MSNAAARLVLAGALALTAVGASIGSAAASATAPSAPHAAKLNVSAPPGANAGPPYTFTTELMGVAPNLGLKDQVMITRTKLGYRLWSGQQSSHLTITIDQGQLRFRDTGTKYYKKLSNACTKEKVKVGISALCRIPQGISEAAPLLIEVWPRLGDDYTDSSTLPASFSVSMLGDEGNDVAKFGAGRDFFNGHLGRDRVYAGDGNDWIRGGDGNDLIDAGAGDDDVVGMAGNDTVFGDAGSDRLWTSDGDDDLVAGVGADLLVCGTGVDRSTADSSDRVSKNCESTSMVSRYRSAH